MKLKLTLGQLAHPAFINAFKLLRAQRWLPKDSYWLSKASTQLEAELVHYHAARADAIRTLGIRVGEDWLIPAPDREAQKKFLERMAPLDERPITLTLNARLKWPLDALISPDEQEILERYSFTEALSIPEPEDKSEPQESGARSQESGVSPPSPVHRNGGATKNRLRKATQTSV